MQSQSCMAFPGMLLCVRCRRNAETSSSSRQSVCIYYSVRTIPVF